MVTDRAGFHVFDGGGRASAPGDGPPTLGTEEEAVEGWYSYHRSLQNPCRRAILGFGEGVVISFAG